MRICIVVRVFPAASESYIVEQVEDLRRGGHQVELISVYERPDPRAFETLEPVRPRYLVGPSLPLPRATARLARRGLQGAVRRPTPFWRTIARYRPGLLWPLEALHALPPLQEVWGTRYDVIHAHFGPTANLVIWLRRLGALLGPVLTTFHGFDATVLPGADRNGDYRRLFRSGEMFTANTSFLRDRLVSLGAPPEAVEVLPVGIDPGLFPFRCPEPDPLAPRLLTVARLVECKGLDWALRAVQRLAWERPGLRYTIIGDGPLRGRLERLSRMLGLQDHVSFAGALPYHRVMKSYADHDLFLLTGVVARDGHVEAQGRVVLEAQAAGLMVVATNVGGVPEVVAPGAAVVPPGDDQAIAAAVRHVLDRPEEWEARARAGRRFVEDGFASPALHERLLALYRRLAGGSVA